jgi:hypothetical protein
MAHQARTLAARHDVGRDPGENGRGLQSDQSVPRWFPMPPAHARTKPSGPSVPALLVHGGAGAAPLDAVDELRDGVRAAVVAGWRMIASGGQLPGRVWAG